MEDTQEPNKTTLKHIKKNRNVIDMKRILKQNLITHNIILQVIILDKLNANNWYEKNNTIEGNSMRNEIGHMLYNMLYICMLMVVELELITFKLASIII